MLPHKIYDEENFFVKCKELRGRFSTEAEDTLFPNLEEKSIPMDGLSIFIDTTWKVIRD